MTTTKFLSVIILILIAGCTGNYQNSPVVNKSMTADKSSNVCKSQPEQPLNSQNVKSIILGENDEVISGMVSKDNQLGYSFEAKSGQTLQYKTDDEICVWIFSPENKILGDLKIAHDGKYVIQVSAPKGSTSFNVKMSLKIIQVAAQAQKDTVPKTEPSISSDKPSPKSEVIAQRSPEKFIQNHYAALNDRNYKYTWTDLSSEFKEKTGGFSSYTQWWDEVERIQVNSTKLVREGNNRAIVEVDIQYKMKSGETVQDDKGRIYLEWNSEEKHWDIVDKNAS